jgi:hypothetical protein
MAEINGKTLVKVQDEDIINGTYEIPENIKVIDAWAFAKCTELKMIVIPDSVTEIRDYAFHACTELESVIIGDSVYKIWEYAFDGCNKLKTVKIGNSVQVLDDGCFSDCSSLEEIEIPASVRCICSEVFLNCSSLKELEIPDTVEFLAEAAIKNCRSLTRVIIPIKYNIDKVVKDCYRLKELIYGYRPYRVTTVGKNIVAIRGKVLVQSRLENAKFYEALKLGTQEEVYVGVYKDILICISNLNELDSALRQEIKRRIIESL